jgi:hypothetical protein
MLNVAVELIALLLYIWEFPGLNLGPETGYPNLNFCDFSVPS